jgi:hypothetical protein
MADRTISQLDPGGEPQTDDRIPVSRNNGDGSRGDYHLTAEDLIAASTNTADEVDYDNASSGLSAVEVQSALDELQSNKVGISQKGAANGVATLDPTGVIPTSQIPPLNITNPFVVDTEAEMLALSAQVGDVSIRTDTGNSYILAGEPAATLSNWKLITASGAVTSVFGRVGVVAPQSGDYTSDQVGYDPGASGLAATTTKAALDELASEKMDASLRRAVNGVAGLDNSGKIYLSELPTDKLTRPHLAADQAAMIALPAEVGDLAIRFDLSNEVFVLVVAPASEVTNWVSITGVGAVTAADVSFDGATSGLSASNLQDAIDALVVNKVKTTAGEAITAGNGVVIRKSDGKAYRVNASNALMMEDAYLTGVAESTASTGQEVLIHFLGPRAGYGSYSGGTILYASDTTPGQMVSTAPANAYMIGLILPGGVLLLGSLGVSQSASTGDGDVPMEPQNLSVSHLADATVFTIEWDVPGSNGGKTITKYIIRVLTGGLATYPGYPVDHIDMGDLSHTTAGGLNEGETYTIQIQAHNVVGTGLIASTTYKIVNAPEVPQNLVISHTLGQVALSLTWQAPANNHGEAPTNYTVTVKDSVDQVVHTNTVAGLSYTTPNTLLEEALYTVELFATNSAGDSAAITGDYTILNVPGDITDLAVVTAVNDVDVNVTWTAPVGGATVQTYRVVITPDAGGAATVDATVNHPTTSYTAVALAYGVYDIAVTAQNSGDVSNPVSIDAFTHEASSPGVPQNLIASTSGQNLTIDWDAPATGVSPTEYEVTVTDGVTPTSQVVNAPTTVYTFVGLATGSYTISVVSRSLGGDSSPATTADYGHGVPSVPQNLSAISSGQDLAVDWDAPATGDVDEYEVTILQESGIGDANTLLVINSDTTNGSTTFVDSSNKAHAITRAGNTVHSTTQKKFGASSLYFDGTGDYLQISSPNAAFNWGTGNFRISYWISVPNAAESGNREILWIGGNAYTAGGIDVQYRLSANQIVLWMYIVGGNTGYYFTIPGGALQNDTFAYIEITRVSGQMYVSINGVQLATATRANNYNFNFVTKVQVGGTDAFGATPILSGYIDNFSIEAKAGNTTNFTPPTEPVPAGGVTVVDTAVVAAPTTQATFVDLPFDTYDVSVVARNESGDSAAATLTDTVHV